MEIQEKVVWESQDCKSIADNLLNNEQNYNYIHK